MLDIFPTRLESFAKIKERFPDGKVQLIPANFRRSHGLTFGLAFNAFKPGATIYQEQPPNS